jgi:hypothetical protein
LGKWENWAIFVEPIQKDSAEPPLFLRKESIFDENIE